MKNLSKTILAIFLTLCCQELVAGQNVGGGDNLKIDPNMAWFQAGRQLKEVNVCIMKSNSFPVSDERILASIDSAFREWRLYAESFKEEDHDWTPIKPKFRPCNGNDNIDIVFYLGVDTEEIRKYKRQYQNPAAFAVAEERTRLKHDLQTTQGWWSKGSVWIHEGNPFLFYYKDTSEPRKLYWAKDNAFEVLIKHEIGHILGNGHVRNTLMDENFVERLILRSQFYVQPHADVMTKEEFDKYLLAIDGYHGDSLVQRDETLVSTNAKLDSENSFFTLSKKRWDSYVIKSIGAPKISVAQLYSCKPIGMVELETVFQTFYNGIFQLQGTFSCLAAFDRSFSQFFEKLGTPFKEELPVLLVDGPQHTKVTFLDPIRPLFESVSGKDIIRFIEKTGNTELKFPDLVTERIGVSQ